LMCPYVSSGKFPVLAPRCSRALLHNLQLTSDRCFIFASHLATGIMLAIAIISRLYVSGWIWMDFLSEQRRATNLVETAAERAANDSLHDGSARLKISLQ